MQLLSQPELLDCMLVLASRMDSVSFAMQFISRIAAASEGAAILVARQRMQLVAAAVEALLQGLERWKQQQQQMELVQQQVAVAAAPAAAAQDDADSGDESDDDDDDWPWPAPAEPAAERSAYNAVVQLLQCMMPLSDRRQGLLVLAPHAQVLQAAAAMLQYVMSPEALRLMRLTVRQVAACRQWAEHTSAAAAAALQQTKAEYADAILRHRCILIEYVAPVFADSCAFAAALIKFVAATSLVEQLEQQLLLAGVEVGAGV
jgi:hypothetical protein